MSVKKISDLDFKDTLDFCDTMADIQTAATTACLALADKYGLDKRAVFGVFCGVCGKASEDDFFWDVVVPANFEDKEG